MKPVASTIKETNTLEGDEVKFSISTANSAWIMRSMADLYSNRELAVIREYSTNAYDANKEKAIKEGTEVEPIQVTLPSMYNPYFTVKDNGIGMSERELREVYTQFGDSTKRDSDDFNGMLGFGSKSAIAYTNTFTVTAVKHGMQTVGVITRREDDMGGYLVTLKIVLSGVETAAPDGVEIQVPVHNYQEFETKAKDFYRFWEPGRVVINGKPSEWVVGDKIDDNLYYYPNTTGRNLSYVVMGNVPYRIIGSEKLFPVGMNRISFVAYVPMGYVEFTPSREDLKYSEHTKNNLKSIITDFVDGSVQKAKDEISSSKNHAEAYKAWSKWRQVIGVGQVDDLTFKGDRLVDTFKIDATRWHIDGGRYATQYTSNWAVSNADKALFVVDFDVKSVNAEHKRKAKAWLGLQNFDADYVLFVGAKTLTSPWVDKDRIITWDRLKEEAPKRAKSPRAATQAWGRKAGSFDLISKSGRKNEQDVPSAVPLYYVSVQEYNSSNMSSILSAFDVNEQVVIVPANRREKFLRFYPNAQNILEILKPKVKLDGNSLLSVDAKKALDIREVNLLNGLDGSRIDDPFVLEYIKLAKVPQADWLKEYNRNYELAIALKLNFIRSPLVGKSIWSRSSPVLDRYPLMAGFSAKSQYSSLNKEQKRNNEHIYLAMNAIYKARKEGKDV